MKLLLVLLCTLAAAVVASGADAARRNVRVEVQIIDVPVELAIPLAGEFLQKDKAEAAFEKLQQLMGTRTASLIAWPFVTTHEGDRAVFESITELRYCNGYKAPVVSFTQPEGSDAAKAAESKWDMTVFDMLPREFQTRNIGTYLEVESVLSADGKMIDLQLTAQRTLLLRFNKIFLAKPDTGGKIVVEQPEIRAHRTESALTVRNGGRVLLGIFRTAEPANQIEFFILRAELIPVD